MAYTTVSFKTKTSSAPACSWSQINIFSYAADVEFFSECIALPYCTNPMKWMTGKKHHLHPHIVVCNVAVCVGGQQRIQFTPLSHLAHTEWIFFFPPSVFLPNYIPIFGCWFWLKNRLCLYNSPTFFWGSDNRTRCLHVYYTLKDHIFIQLGSAWFWWHFFCNRTVWVVLTWHVWFLANAALKTRRMQW